MFGCGVVAALAATVRYRQRFTALIFVGVAGLMVSLVFVLLSAPDLALTQLLVEVVTVVLMLLVLHHLPQSAPVEHPAWRRWRDALVATGAGLGIAAVAYAVMRRPFDSISPYYLAHALPDGGGSNVVNVIIVDFRGFDTLGEIAVLAIAALVVHALLGSHPAARNGPLRPPPTTARCCWRSPRRCCSRWRRSSRSTCCCAATTCPAAASSPVWCCRRRSSSRGLPAPSRASSRRGCGIPSGSRPGSPSPSRPAPAASHWAIRSLTSSFGHPVVPGLGEIPLATAALFDLGVFVAVVAASLLALEVPARLGGPLARQWSRDEA
ncbi:MAG: DUF4040 domain-containing protein [Betaproteobacteria bacterium]|nr:DUF4040 domain-containing protein [Betaproteobacteria bacterium]